MHWIIAKIALFIAIIWGPAPIAVIPVQPPVQVASSTVPHVIIKAMSTEANSQQNADNQPLVGVEAPEVVLQAPEVTPNAPQVILSVPVTPGPAGTPVPPVSTPAAPIYNTDQGFGSHPYTEADFNK